MFCRELYVDEYVSKHFRNIRKKIKNRTLQPGVFVLIMSEYGRLEYMHNAFLCQPFYKENHPFIIGLAHSKENVLDIVMHILQETFESRGDADIFSYLKEKTEAAGHSKKKTYHFTVVKEKGK